MSEQRHFTKTKPILISKPDRLEASPDAHYGPWDSISDYIDWLKEITLDDNIKPPVGVRICIINQNTKDCFTYYETSSSIGYWKDDDGGVLLSETEGSANKSLLNALLAEGNVKLRKGNYIVSTGVVVDNVTLDLNGACLTCASFNNKGLLQIKGEKPVVRNGELCGTFHDFDGNPNDDPEDEGLIRCFLYGDALIENVELHNCQGYAMCHGNPDWEDFHRDNIDCVRTKLGASTEILSNNDAVGNLTESRQFVSGYKDIVAGYKYINVFDTASDNRVLSVRNVVYKFYPSDSNTPLATIEEVPRVMVPIPEGATRVRVVTYRYTDYLDNLYLGFYNIDVKCITINNCCIHNNYRLGIVGLAYGTMKIMNCRSYSQGKPTKGSLIRNTNTVAFFNAEDLCIPKLIMEGCTSEDDLNLALVGAYEATITGCTGVITVYRGWHTNISNCVGLIDTSSTNILTMINVSNCVITSNPRTSPNWIGNNNVFIDCNIYDITRENNFIVRREHRTSGTTGAGQTPAIAGLVRGKIYNSHVTSGNFGIGRIATEKGSHFEYVWNNASNLSDASHGAVPVTGDCYGITANCPFYPNGKKIYDSKFTPIHNFGAGSTSNNYWSGEYVNCTFNIVTGAMFHCASGYGISGTNKTLIFRNCIFNITEAAAGATQYYLFRTGLSNAVANNFKVKFINCKLNNSSLTNNQSLLFHPTDANNIPYEIIEYDDSIDSLLARIEALEQQ